MITASIFRTKATISFIYLILYTVLGVYLLFTSPDQDIHNSEKAAGQHAGFSVTHNRIIEGGSEL